MSALEDSKPVLMRPAALWWASKGVPVFPLHNAVLTPQLTWACSCGDPCKKDSPAKHPRTAHGVNDATTDPAVINTWWERWPEANIGLACGVTFDLLDLDGPAGFDTLRQIEAELGPLTPTCVVNSGRAEGGRHYYLTPPGLGGLQGGTSSPKGIDVKSVGGYVVAPPSQHITGSRYEMTLPYTPSSEVGNWQNVHNRLRELAPKKPHTETRPGAAPRTVADHRSDAWRRRARNWCSKALDGAASTLAGMAADTGRNNHLNAQAWRLLRMASAGHLEAQDVLDTLRQAAQTSGLSSTETETTLRSAVAGALRDGPLDPDIGEDIDFDPFTGEISPAEPNTDTGEAPAPPTTPPATGVDEEAFWTARPELEHIRTFARARRSSPWGVLGVVLARVITATPPYVVLPAMVGSHASLNLFIALVGRSGGGKGAAESAAGDAMRMPDIEIATVGSGEGIGHLYAHREKGVIIRDRDAVLFTVPEVDNLVALAGRQGATLLPQLRSAWSGEKLGFAYADPAKRLPIDRHTYRMGLVLGVQPGRAAALLDDADGGTPQRFLWLPTADPEAPDIAPETPEPLVWTLPVPWTADTFSGLAEMAIPDSVRLAVGMASLARLRAEGDALDGHAMLARLKAAAAIALLAGRQHMTEQDWQLSDVLMAVSNATRASVVEYLQSKARTANAAKGEAEGARAILVEERVTEANVKRVARKVLSKLRAAGGELARSEVRTSIAARDRQHFEEALDRLLEAGTVAVEEAEKGQRIKLVE